MTLVNDLKDICKDLKGTFLSIGLCYPTVESVIDKNKNITEGYLLVLEGKKKGKTRSKDYNKKVGRKKISIKKLRKTFKKKSVDTLILNYEDAKKYMRFFVSDSVYINKGKLYIYGKKDKFTIDDIKSYYGRYNTKVEIKEYDNDFLIIIDNTNSKNNYFKDKMYKFKDTIIYYINVIGDILIG